MHLTQEILTYIEQHREEALRLLLELAQIPAPSHHEERRAAFCRDWLEKKGAEGVFIDEALNVIYPVGCREDRPLVVFMAHSDVVFPDTEALPLTVENGRIHCPGVGDDTANVVALLMTAAYIAEHRLEPKEHGVLLVVNSCEEGLGDLKGCRRLMERYGSRIRELVSFDGTCSFCVDRAVGSRRYRIAFDTEGGHSYGSFGNRNAIACMASMIDALYSIKVPEKGRTTYNVGTISGGTSVNTIAQHAEMLYEFRSDEAESLSVMERHLEAAVAFYRAKGITVTVTQVGDRPCSGPVDQEKMETLRTRAAAAIRRYYGREVRFGAGSTDCNVPLSLGIPAVCFGCYIGAGAHTREEHVEIDSLLPGLKLAFDQVLYHF